MSSPAVTSQVRGHLRRTLLVRVSVITWLLLWVAISVLVLSDYAPTNAEGGEFGYDFRDTVWLPIRDFLDGFLPWDFPSYSQRYPFAQIYPLYTPSYWWVVSPLLLLPYPVALVVWLGFTTACVVGLISWSIGALTRRSGLSLLIMFVAVIVVFLVSRAGRSGLLTTNFSVPCGAAAGLLLAGAGGLRSRIALIMTALIKPQVGLPLLGTALINQQRKAPLIAVAATIVLCLPIGVLVLLRAGGFGPALGIAVESLALGHGVGTAPGEASSTQVDLSATFEHLVTLAGWQSTGLTLLAGLVTYVGYALALRRFEPRSAEALLLGGFAVVLVLPNMIYSLIVLIPGLVVLADRLIFTWRRLSRTELIWSLVTALFIAAALANTGPVYQYLGIWPQLGNFLTGIFLFAAAVTLLLRTTFSTPTAPPLPTSAQGDT